MLEPDARVVLLDQLRPPAGHRLDAAVATTFTLSMSTALVPPLAFATFDTSDATDPLAVLEAVRSCADRVDVFCQAGQIAVPSVASDLVAFLEPMVHPVTAPRPGYLFHPKVWLLRFVADDDEPVFRLVCSSRNLVDSSAWDCAVTLDGVLGDVEADVAGDGTLAAFVRSLPAMAVTPLDDERLARVESLARDAERIRWELPPDVSELRFHAWGVPGLTPTADFEGSRHLVISPFVDPAGLAHVGGRRPRVVSRQEALDLLPDEALRGDVFVLDPAAAADPDLDDARPVGTERTGLHAKVTVVERDHGARVFIGSPNATAAAYGGNVEAAVELVGRSARIGSRTILGDDAAPPPGEGRTLRAFLQPWVRAEPVDRTEEEAIDALKRALRTLCAVPFTLTVEQQDGGYLLRLRSARDVPLPDGVTATARALKDHGHVQALVAGPADVPLGPLGLTDITPFVEIEVTDDAGRRLASVVHAPLQGDPPGRLDEVLARQVDTPEKFLRLLALLLGRDGASGWGAPADTAAEGGPWSSSEGLGSGLLEDLVVALADRPADLDAVARLVERLSASDRGRQTLPDGFAELWAAVTSAREDT